MEDFEETFNYDYDDESLNMFLYHILKKLDVSAKRRFSAMFLDALGVNNQRDPSDPTTRHVRIQLSKDCKSRVNELLEHADIIFFHILNKKQRKLYSHFSGIEFFLKYGMTGTGYIEFLNACNSLARLTGLPFSLEEEYGGLKTWDAWNAAVEKAIEDCKVKFGRKGNKKKGLN
jgi:hypothetical protein